MSSFSDCCGTPSKVPTDVAFLHLSLHCSEFSSTVCNLTLLKVQEKENLTWSAIELALLKKDSVPRHGNNENQVVLIPEISDHRVPLVELDSDESRLLKVVYLRAGSALVFIETFVESPLLSVYYCRQLGTDLTRAKPKAQFRKLPDLIAFDEGSKLLAMYVKSTESIKFYRFD